MLIEEIINERLIRHFSDLRYRIRQIETGIVYDDAVDIIPCKYTYEETNIPIPDEDEIDNDEEVTDEWMV